MRQRHKHYSWRRVAIVKIVGCAAHPSGSCTVIASIAPDYRWPSRATGLIMQSFATDCAARPRSRSEREAQQARMMLGSRECGHALEVLRKFYRGTKQSHVYEVQKRIAQGLRNMGYEIIELEVTEP